MKHIAIILIGSLYVGHLANARGQESLFVNAPSSPLAVGRGSGRVVLADFNRDGHMDLLTKHLLTKSISLRLGDGKGNFDTKEVNDWKVGYSPGAIAVADINNDNIPDLGIASHEGDRENLHVYLGDGRGKFKEVSGSPLLASVAMETYKPTLQFIDINGDGKQDIVTANGRRNSVETMLGNGNGHFSRSESIALEPGRDRYAFLIEDFNGDGRFDLITTSTSDFGEPGQLTVRLGSARGGFANTPHFSSPLAPKSRVMTVADMNGDGRLDLVLADEYDLTVMQIDENGSLVAVGRSVRLGMEAFTVIAADINGDKKMDLLAATVDSHSAPFGSRLVVLLGEAAGKFVTAPGSPFPVGPGAYGLSIGDINEDNKPDLAASSFEGDALTLLIQR